MRLAFRTVLALSLLLGAAGASAAEITIYRCTDAQGQLALRDTPCKKGQTQQTLEMQRPKDAPPAVRRAASAPKAAPNATPAEPAPRHVVSAPARPMYECVTPDGNRYLSDTSAGNPRWVPLWTLGYPGYGSLLPPRREFYPGNVQANVQGSFNRGGGRYSVTIGDRPPRPPHDVPPPGYAVDAYGAGTWVYDECHALPQADVCARLRDERWELSRRYNSALQSERDDIDRQQRGLDARLASDCGGG